MVAAVVFGLVVIALVAVLTLGILMILGPYLPPSPPAKPPIKGPDGAAGNSGAQ